MKMQCTTLKIMEFPRYDPGGLKTRSRIFLGRPRARQVNFSAPEGLKERSGADYIASQDSSFDPGASRGPSGGSQGPFWLIFGPFWTSVSTLQRLILQLVRETPGACKNAAPDQRSPRQDPHQKTARVAPPSWRPF